MPFNGAGLFVPVAFPDYPAVSGDLIRASLFNNNIADLHLGLSNCLTRNGQSPATANLPMAGNRHTGVGAALTDTDYARYDQVKADAVQTLANKTLSLSANTVTGTLAQFNTALSDADFVTLLGVETLSNKTINFSANSLTGTAAAFNTACSDADFMFLTSVGYVAKDSLVGAAALPAGTTAQRPAQAPGKLRFNTDTNKAEVSNGTAWGSVGGGATGGVGDDVFYENGQVVAVSYTLTVGKNAGTFGPVTIDNGVTVTVPNGSVWSIV